MASPRLDPLTKAMGQQALEMAVQMPVGLEVVRRQARFEAAMGRQGGVGDADAMLAPVVAADAGIKRGAVTA